MNVKLQMVLMSELLGIRKSLDPKSMELLEKLKEFSKMLETAAANRKKKELEEAQRAALIGLQSDHGHSHSDIV
jgi:hypothetical protein